MFCSAPRRAASRPGRGPIRLGRRTTGALSRLARSADGAWALGVWAGNCATGISSVGTVVLRASCSPVSSTRSRAATRACGASRAPHRHTPRNPPPRRGAKGISPRGDSRVLTGGSHSQFYGQNVCESAFAVLWLQQMVAFTVRISQKMVSESTKYCIG